ENALANSPIASARLDVDDDVDSRKSVEERLFHAIGGRMALADRGSRRDADDDVGEVLPTRPTESETSELDRRIERRDRKTSDTRVVLGRAIHEDVHVPARESERGCDDETGDEERRDRVAGGE